MRVPLIVRVPRRRPERTKRIFASVDFYPTILSLLGSADRGSVSSGLDQSDLWALRTATGEKTDSPDRSIAFSEYTSRCAFDGRVKLVTDLAMNAVLELYDLDADPYEMENKKDDRDYDNDVERLLSALRSEFVDGAEPNSAQPG